MGYEIRLKGRAKKEYEKLQERDKLRVSVVFTILRSNPYVGKKLKGKHRGFYSLRSWPYRIMYAIDEEKPRVVVMRIRHRGGNVYR